MNIRIRLIIHQFFGINCTSRSEEQKQLQKQLSHCTSLVITCTVHHCITVNVNQGQCDARHIRWGFHENFDGAPSGPDQSTSVAGRTRWKTPAEASTTNEATESSFASRRAVLERRTRSSFRRFGTRSRNMMRANSKPACAGHKDTHVDVWCCVSSHIAGIVKKNQTKKLVIIRKHKRFNTSKTLWKVPLNGSEDKLLPYFILIMIVL